MLEHLSRSAEERRTLDSLGKLSGAGFDRKFVEAVVESDGREIDRLDRSHDRPSVSSDLRDLIGGLRPAVQHQLDEAKALQDLLSKG
jgi:predicted outer membrane protein